MPFALVRPAIDYSVRGMCRLPYYNHPKGCPNFDKKKGCPPSAPKVESIIDLNDDVYIIYNCFDFLGHVQRMQKRHPKWSQRQAECCLYWQGTARNQLKEELKKFWRGQDYYYRVLTCPEACGVDVTKTMRTIGIGLEWPPKNYTYQVALAGISKSRG